MKGPVINVCKFSGAGNTFGIKMLEKKLMDLPKLAQKISHPVKGFSSDGVLFLEKGSKRGQYIWHFFNSDGSPAEMCGNAARCAAQYCIEELGDTASPLEFITGAGPVFVEREHRGFLVSMPTPKILETRKTVKLGNETQSGLWVDTGVPHFVLQTASVKERDGYRAMASSLRQHADFKPKGTNVTYWEPAGPEGFHQIKAVTFERGVEDYTLACGTGAVAAAIAASLAGGGQKGEIQIDMPGGRIWVKLSAKGVQMIGSSVFVGEMSMNMELL